MIRKLSAVFENGTLRPLEPINLQEHERVTLSLEEAEGAGVGELISQEGDPQNLPTERVDRVGASLFVSGGMTSYYHKQLAQEIVRAVAEDSPATETRPWRGVFQTDSLKAPIFSREIEVRTSDLPYWEPQITVNRRWTENDE